MRTIITYHAVVGFVVFLSHFLKENCAVPTPLEHSDTDRADSEFPGDNFTPNGPLLITLYCDTGRSLVVTQNSIESTRNHGNSIAALEKQSAGVGVVSMKGVLSRHYLAMNANGDIYSSETFTEDCVFREASQDGYYYYSSARNPVWFISIDKSGQVKRTQLIGRKRTHFLPLILRPEAQPI